MASSLSARFRAISTRGWYTLSRVDQLNSLNIFRFSSQQALPPSLNSEIQLNKDPIESSYGNTFPPQVEISGNSLIGNIRPESRPRSNDVMQRQKSKFIANSPIAIFDITDNLVGIISKSPCFDYQRYGHCLRQNCPHPHITNKSPFPKDFDFDQTLHSIDVQDSCLNPNIKGVALANLATKKEKCSGQTIRPSDLRLSAPVARPANLYKWRTSGG